LNADIWHSPLAWTLKWLVSLAAYVVGDRGSWLVQWMVCFV